MKNNYFRRNSLRLFVLVGIGVIVGLDAWNTINSQQKNRAHRQERDAEIAEQMDTAITQYTQESKSLIPTPTVNRKRHPASTASSMNFAQSPTGVKLSEYARLKKMVLMSAENRALKGQLLRDKQLLKDLRVVLHQPAGRDLQTQELQSLAIDMLLEARLQGDADAAGESLRSVVEDSRIEDKSVALKERKSLAGIKAELLYQWAAQEPEMTNTMAGWLPGPMSQLIWNNILEAQKRNRSALAYDSNGDR